MDLKTLLSQKCTVLHQQDDNGIALIVKESAKYRWFEYGGTSTQSLMNKSLSEEILMPVYQSLLLFLLFKSTPLKILNLGLGGASIERALATIPHLLLTSVDSSQAVIDMAKRYFNLPSTVEVVCQQAEQFIEQTDTLYDVVLCDLFIGENNPKFLFKEDFYQQLATIMVANRVLMINLQADTDEQLIHAVLAIKTVFHYIALMEFDDYSNIVIIASSHEIPEQARLQQQLANFTLLDFSCFLNSSLEQAIEKMRYIPRISR
jgi:spermidine synthase